LLIESTLNVGSDSGLSTVGLGTGEEPGHRRRSMSPAIRTSAQRPLTSPRPRPHALVAPRRDQGRQRSRRIPDRLRRRTRKDASARPLSRPRCSCIAPLPPFAAHHSWAIIILASVTTQRQARSPGGGALELTRRPRGCSSGTILHGAHRVKTQSCPLTPASWQGKHVLCWASSTGLPSMKRPNPQPPVVANFLESLTII
jgi:hypothetical protein